MRSPNILQSKQNEKRPYFTGLFFLAMIFFGVFGMAESSQAKTINVVNASGQPSCERVDIQAVIDISLNNDVVILAKGDCTWSASVTIPNSKGIILDGNDSTIYGHIDLSQNTNTSSRITKFNFIKNNAIRTSGSKNSAPYRIDHCTFTSIIGGSVLLDVGSGNAPGLIDHNSFNAPKNSEMIHNWGMGAIDASGWSDDIVPGSAAAVYVEDNTFTNNDPMLATANPAYFWGNSAIQSYYGARTVFRYNLLNMSQVDQHGTPGMIGARWWEIYENTFHVVLNGSQSNYMQIRAGSGVIFNNHKIGYPCVWGCGVIELVEEDSGYPALYQIGRGKNQTSDPAYIWGNDALMPVGSGSSNVVEGRDFYQSAKPGYTAYVYPHPLQTYFDNSPDTTPPAPPSGLIIM